MRQFHTYQQAVSFLINEVPETGRAIQSPEERIAQVRQVMRALGSPQNAHRAIHIAGTSGKGTICYLVDAILRAHTKHCGLLQSPHVYDIRERIQINGQLVSERKFVQYLLTALHAFYSEGVPLSYSDIMVTMGFIAFGKSQLDYTVVEVGIGGRLDKTNVITRKDKLAVLGQIGYDHTEMLGNTLRKIAGEKAGIVQDDNLVVALRQDMEVTTEYETILREKHASVEWVEQANNYQKTNDAMAIKICQTLANRDGWQLDLERTHEVLETTFIPGRYEKREYKNHFIVLDGAHNPQKLNALAQRLISEKRTPVTLIISLKQTKDLKRCLLALQPAAKRIIATEFFTNMKRAPFLPVPADEIVDACQEIGIDAVAKPSPNLALNYAASFSEPIVATGSFYILSEIDAAF